MTTTERRFHGPAARAIREAIGVNGSTFATRVVVSHGYLTNIEKGVKQPSPEVARRIADGLGVPLDAITYPVQIDCPSCTARKAKTGRKAAA